jgi:hypothetical protein
MINEAHAWCALPDRGQQLLRRLYQELTESRHDLTVILAGQASPLGDLLRASLALAARFPAVIDFPRYTAGQFAAIFATLAGEAGFTLTPAAARKAASQARRVTTASQPRDPAMLSTIRAADIPGHIHPHDPPADDQWPGQYL